VGPILVFGFPCGEGPFTGCLGKEFFLSTLKDYVVDYYGVFDWNVLLAFEFDPDKIIFGNLTDREPEFSAPEAKLISWEVFQN